MGLDMYLSRHVTVANYDFDPKGQQLAKAIMDALGVREEHRAQYTDGTFTVSLPAAYWRKANAIHGWFVHNVQNDVDDCRSYYVSEEQLKTLRDLCASVLNGSVPKDELPPKEGFFFGDTENDEWYRADLANTIEKLDRVMAAPPLGQYGNSFYYQSSW